MARIAFWSAVATLVGTTIGAGVLGIPYVIAKAGFITGIIDIMLIGAAIVVLNLYMGELTLRTKGNHQLSGYAEKYLGGFGKLCVMLAMAIGIYGALIAYTLGGGEALKAIFGGSEIAYSFIFFAVLITMVFFGINMLSKSELLIATLVVGVVVIISALCLGRINATNLSGFNPGLMFMPYGVILFAFIGATAIPEMREELAKNKKQLKKAIIIGSLIPLVVYILFALAVVGVVGAGFETVGEHERIATVALSLFVGKGMGLFANVFAVLAMSTSFLALGVALSEMYQYDYGFNKAAAWLATASLPLAIFLVDSFVKDITSFIGILGIVGAVTGGILGITIVTMHRLAKLFGERKPEFVIHDELWVSIILVAMFVLGIAYQIII